MCWHLPGTTVKRPNGKGRRWIILHGASELGWVPIEPMLYEANDHSDYHQSMNADAFEEWFEKLCKTLAEHEQYKDRQIVVHMDNASYHKRGIPEDLKLSEMKVSDLMSKFAEMNIQRVANGQDPIELNGSGKNGAPIAQDYKDVLKAGGYSL
eukprot:Pompholyxophrys_punicea_v1_NODE_934_length_1121_cov_1.423077.p1 type:complete len:153 gc:universal NODE_934_length_1121_cov_1.423077:775-317(-)